MCGVYVCVYVVWQSGLHLEIVQGCGGNWRNPDFKGGHDGYRCDKVS